MILHALNDDNLLYLKNNIEAFSKFYKEPTNNWISQYIENPFDEYFIEVDDFTLDGNKGDAFSRSVQDVENTKTLYKAMRSLTPLQASDERLWSGMAHSDFWSFLNSRYEMSENHERSIIKNHYFFNAKVGRRKAMLTNCLSRYWWIGYLVYDKNRENPFELMDYFKPNFHYRTASLFGRNFSNNKTIVRGVLSGLLELEKAEKSSINSDKLLTETGKYLNLLGGSSLLDYYSEEEIRDKVIGHFRV